jgi:hypothetical protein
MTKEALKLALEALENHCGNYKLDDAGCERWNKAVAAINVALAQPEQEPVAWGYRSKDGEIYDCISPEAHADCEGEYNVPLYTTPPKRTWVGLTDEEISATSKGHIVRSTYARAIEAALKEKNYG